MKILMTTMGLGIGGAETHVVELSKELVAQGNTVIVASNGGEYVPEIEAAGVRHVKIPMHKRSPFSMIRSYFMLLALILRERPMVIHAHARIPAFISHFVTKITRTPLVTTAHGWFKTGGALGFLTRWGQKVIAVSDDIKEYLIREYDIPQSNITVTVNGIDTERFSPSTDCEDLKKEFDITDEKIILTVCRMDDGACKSAYLLLECARELHGLNPNSRLILVGSGNALARVKERAALMNKELKKEFVIVTGGRTDVYKFVSMADVFVGVSRAALEAMSCNTPTVLSGNAGYLGLYEPSKLSQCIQTNFTCKDFPYPLGNKFFKEVERALLLSQEERDALCSRDLIINSYSVSRMAKDAFEAYRSVLTPTVKSRTSKPAAKRGKNDFLLAGYYGFENAGDEALLKSIVENLRKQMPDAKICVLVKKGMEYKNIDVTTANRFGLFGVIHAIRNSKVLIFGGGNLIQDATSTASAFYYLSLLKIAKIYGLKTMLYGNGVGPIDRKITRIFAKNVLSGVDVITLRERLSLEIFGELKIVGPRIELTADEIFSYLTVAKEKREYLTVSVRAWNKMDKNFAEKIAKVTELCCKRYGLTARLLPLMQKQDLELSKKVFELLNCEKELLIPESHLGTIEAIGESRFVIGMRLHALIFSVVSGVPFYPISYDPKIDAFAEYAGAQGTMPCAHIDADAMFSAITEMFENEAENCLQIKRRSAELALLASKNATLAIELLSKI